MSILFVAAGFEFLRHAGRIQPTCSPLAAVPAGVSWRIGLAAAGSVALFSVLFIVGLRLCVRAFPAQQEQPALNITKGHGHYRKSFDGAIEDPRLALTRRIHRACFRKKRFPVTGADLNGTIEAFAIMTMSLGGCSGRLLLLSGKCSHAQAEADDEQDAEQGDRTGCGQPNAPRHTAGTAASGEHVGWIRPA